jgi:hypothetical protein
VSTFGHADAGKTLDKRAFLLSYARIFFAKLVSWIFVQRLETLFGHRDQAGDTGPQERSTAANHVWLMIVLDTNIVAALMANGADIDLACKS